MVKYVWDVELCRNYADSLRPLVKYDHGRIAKIISKRIDKKPNQKIIDIAAGPGFLLLELSKFMDNPILIAQDMHANMLRIAKEETKRYSKDITICECPAEELTLENESVDIAVCKQLLHEAQNHEKVLKEICRILKPGGKAFIIDFDADCSRIAARLLKLFLRVMSNKMMAASFWSSFNAGLKGETIAEQLRSLKLNNVEYIKMGPNYFITGIK